MKNDGNILVLTQWSFKDALVQTYTLPYLEIIRKIVSPERKIILVTAEQATIALSKSEGDAINKEWVSRNMQVLALPYREFGLKKIIASVGHLFKLYQIIKKEKIKVIHAFCTPAGSIAYLLCKLTGAKLIIDSYEPHAEAMIENGTWKREGVAFNILFRLEKRQTRLASAIIATTEGMKQYALEKYGVSINNLFVKPACVDLEKFVQGEKDLSLLKELNLENKIVCVYAGKLGGIYLKEEVFDFIKACYNHWKDDFRFLMLTNASRDEINAGVKRAGVPAHVVISMYVMHGNIPGFLSLADFAINPVKQVPTKRYCTSIKDGEYWAMGLPVIISPNISDDSEIIRENGIGIVIDLTQKETLQKAVIQMDALLKNNTRESLQKKIVKVAEKYRSFDIARKIYPLIYES